MITDVTVLRVFADADGFGAGGGGLAGAAVGAAESRYGAAAPCGRCSGAADSGLLEVQPAFEGAVHGRVNASLLPQCQHYRPLHAQQR